LVKALIFMLLLFPYSFRHQFAADLKNDLSPEEIAMAMGHSVCRTQQHMVRAIKENQETITHGYDRKEP